MSRREFRIGDAGVHAYGLLTDVVVPRPIAWVSTHDADGIVNVAPHSFYSVASAHPPVVCFTSVGRKDTLRNIEATGEFVVNLASAPQLHAINDSSAPYPADVSEADRVGIAMEPSTWVAPPRVRDSPVAIECRLRETIPVGDSVLVLGDVVGLAVAERVLHDGRPAYDALEPLARLGGNQWALPGDVIAVDRPTQA